MVVTFFKDSCSFTSNEKWLHLSYVSGKGLSRCRGADPKCPEGNKFRGQVQCNMQAKRVQKRSKDENRIK